MGKKLFWGYLFNMFLGLKVFFFENVFFLVFWGDGGCFKDLWERVSVFAFIFGVGSGFFSGFFGRRELKEFFLRVVFYSGDSGVVLV